jgi:Na+-transporting NADH:ubiquinone oxidoreductase subunit B
MFSRLMKQTIMNRVLYALAPITIFAIYLFGWRVLAVVMVANISAYYTEYLFIRNKKGAKVSMAVFVTATLFALTLPPTIPLWISAVGAIFSVAFGKMVFGGFGTNIFNPAILGRTFVYISFPNQMTVSWIKPFGSLPGGFAYWSGNRAMETGATILNQHRLGVEGIYKFSEAFFGFVSGSIGETSAVLILLAGLYMVLTKTAKWQPMIGTILSVVICNMVFYPGINPLYFLVSGGALFGIVFMTTDPVSQPKGGVALWIYAILVGFLTVFIRRFSLFAEGFMFALLLANSIMPLIEYGLERLSKKRSS